MLRSVFFLINVGIWALFSTVAAQQVFKNSDLEISILEENVWVIETTDKTTMYLIEGSERAMLIDTGTKCEDLDKVVEKITQKPLIVVITHIHQDHSGNMDYFRDVYFHPADTVLMSRVKPYKGKIHFVADGDILDLGDRQVVVSHMPAHTPGSIILIDQKSGSCFSGDAFGSGLVWLQLRPFAPIKTYVQSLEKMEKWMESGISKIYCGHYPYLKQWLGSDYIMAMKNLAFDLDNGKASGAQPYPVKVAIGAANPMIVSNGPASIVYDPEHIK